MTRRSRAGFAGRSRAIEGDQVRNRRNPQTFPLGPGLEWDSAGRLVVRTAGALTTQSGALEVEVTSPLSQASPIELNFNTETLQSTKAGELDVRLKADGGIETNGRGLKVSDAILAAATNRAGETGFPVLQTIREVAGLTVLVQPTDVTLVIDTLSNATTVQLDAIPDDGRVLRVKRNGPNTVTVDGNGNNIDGAATFDLLLNHETVTLHFNGDTSEWWIV